MTGVLGYSRRRRSIAVGRLRAAVFALPRDTRESMLEGIRSQEIIVGDYTTPRGGVCPMLAAHRCGARSDFKEFARAWDGLGRTRRARLATSRELDVLEALLEESVAGPSAGCDGRAGEPEADPSEGAERLVASGP